MNAKDRANQRMRSARSFLFDSTYNRYLIIQICSRARSLSIVDACRSRCTKRARAARAHGLARSNCCATIESTLSAMYI